MTVDVTALEASFDDTCVLIGRCGHAASSQCCRSAKSAAEELCCSESSSTP